MKTHTCASLSGVVAFAVAQLLLQIEYPWSSYAAFNFGKGITLASYLLAAVIVAAIAAITTGLCLSTFKGVSFVERRDVLRGNVCVLVADCLSFGSRRL